ncbi:hypothetical protein VNI00_018828 [Paramarasmius palmivorus]|uniref:CxC2-like cysteine cluster KDZ transposase-associated domain-containing protein n=1 Tax=Paramarasmius palmivorus TaxID=297713 RepID=A0AAW0ATH5_9AGAR
MDVVRQWRHLKMGKRAGRGHDPTGIAGTPDGGTAVLCRACPHEGINIPPDWMQAPADKAWLYTLTLAMDANFKQKARLRPNDAKDPPLGPGFACTVNHEVYLQEVMKRTKDQDEISHCASFAAVYSANTKKSKGLRATGIGSVICARHQMFWSNGTGDLQKGERQVNMDWVFLSAIIFCQLIYVVISYDIACQWAIHFYARMSKLPKQLHMPSYRQLRFKVPKFHLPAHKDECHAPYALNFTEGVGKVDGEGIERNWPFMNELARSLSVMMPGGRWDTMDDHCNASNHRKTVQLGKCIGMQNTALMKRLTKGITEAVIYTRAFSAFHEALMVDHAELIEQWTKQLEEWERDPNKPCPYNLPSSSKPTSQAVLRFGVVIMFSAITMGVLKKQLAEEELKRERTSGMSSTGMSMSAMVIEAIDIEDAQRNLATSLKASSSTVYQDTDLLKRRTALLRRIRKFREAQVAHVPSIRPHVEAVDVGMEDIEVENIPLLLPSDPYFNDADRLAIFPADIILIEARLREAQAFDALAELRNKLRARKVAAQYKTMVVPTQTIWTRQRTLQDVIGRKIQAASDTYRNGRGRLYRIKGSGEWTQVLRELHPNDVRGINERLLLEEEKGAFRKAQAAAGVSEAEISAILEGMYGVPTVPQSALLVRGESERLPLSWIWYTTRHGDKSHDQLAEQEGASVGEIEASLRVEWCKARALARRAKEEIILVEEEMRRSIQFCRTRATWWISQIGRRSDISSWLTEGLAAYAREQAAIETCRAESWAAKWAAIRLRGREVQASLNDDNKLNALSQLKEIVVEIDIEDPSDGTRVGDML